MLQMHLQFWMYGIKIFKWFTQLLIMSITRSYLILEVIRIIVKQNVLRLGDVAKNLLILSCISQKLSIFIAMFLIPVNG